MIAEQQIEQAKKIIDFPEYGLQCIVQQFVDVLLNKKKHADKQHTFFELSAFIHEDKPVINKVTFKIKCYKSKQHFEAITNETTDDTQITMIPTDSTDWFLSSCPEVDELSLFTHEEINIHSELTRKEKELDIYCAIIDLENNDYTFNLL